MPKRVDHDERRRQIAEALVRIASTRGLQAASMREVAAEAGVSLRLVQYYFHTKDELLRGALHLLGEQISARMQRHVRALGTPPTPRTTLYGAVTALLPTDEDSRRIVLAYTAYYTLSLTDPTMRAHGLGYAGALEDFLVDTIRQAQDAGEISPAEDPTMVAATVFALISGLQSSVLAGQRDGRTALGILTHHLDRLFTPAADAQP